jgi:signal transduction histidine kinase
MWNKISYYLFRNPDEIGFENFLLLILGFMTIIIGLIGTLINIALNLDWELVAATLIPTVIFIPVYLYSRNSGKFTASRYITTILVLLVLNSQWFMNNGSKGPILYLYVLLECFIIIFFKNRIRLYAVLVVFANLTFLFFLEYRYPALTGDYPSETIRLLDVYLGMIIYLVICFLLISMAFGFYIREREVAQNADKLKSAFLANMSHEIRTPMNGILGFAELMKEPGLTGKQQQEYLTIIEKSGERMLGIINDIVDISKIEAGLMTVSLGYTDVNEMVSDIHSFFNPEAEEKGLVFSIHRLMPAPKPRIQTDPDKLYAILSNLVKNALKFTKAGTIELGYCKSGRFIEFYVQDTGPGIPHAEQRQIFDRFIQSEYSRNKQIRGTGLGLSISKAYVELLGGHIRLESEPGKGSKFSFTIPYQPEIQG